ncbi:hypothetical protein [Brevibacillus sp. SYSU BS000544]|uniref:hypothetical protein n=1 Tax=Brevibacillus sp. SYSU BS000544 TaxID=3416443 RepID=UPI003CE4BFB2
MNLIIEQIWLVLFTSGLFWLIWSLFTLREGTLRIRDKPDSYRILRLRERSKKWVSTANWEGIRQQLKRAGLTLSLGEYLLFFLLLLFTVESFLAVCGVLLQSKGVFVVTLILPFGSLWLSFYYVQYRSDQRKRILQGDFIHCFSRLADFVQYHQISDFEKIRRSLVGTRILHQALVEEVYFRKDISGALQKMEEWVAFPEEKLMLRNALHEALYSLPEISQKSLIYSVDNLRARRAARWRRELARIEFFALLSPRVGVGVFAVIMITSMWLVIKKMMGWS